MPKNIILTGGSRGIGAAVVATLAAEGHRIAFSYQSNSRAADEVVKEVSENSGTVFAIKADVADFETAGRFVAEAKERLGNDADVLINNAGITRDKSLFIMPKEEWDAVINTNLNGYFNVTRHLIGYFMKMKKGCVVNMTSVSGFTGMPGQTNYCASKAGIIGFTKALAKEVAKLNIPVNCVAPGFIETDMTTALDPAHVEQIKKMVPMQRLGRAAEVANLVSFLISDKAKYITGQVFTIDGGLTC